MSAWWSGLSGLTQGMYCGAVFFSVLLVWQLISALLGLTTDASDIADLEGADSVDALDTTMAFQLLSLRSILAFFTLFTWGTALYLDRGATPGRAMGIASLWGLGGMVSVAALLYALPKLAHTGTKQLGSCVGSRGTVYLDIPAGGVGQARVMVSGVLSHVDARVEGGAALSAGTPIVVVRQLDHKTVELKAAEAGKE
jgi:hypothetical protein